MNDENTSSHSGQTVIVISQITLSQITGLCVETDHIKSINTPAKIKQNQPGTEKTQKTDGT